MRALPRLPGWTLALAVAAALAGAWWLSRDELAARRTAFETDARIAHRLLSQRAVQHDAILSTLGLLQPAAAGEDAPERRLLALYPQLLRVLRRDAGAAWPGEAAERQALSAAEADSRRHSRAALAAVDFERGHYLLVQGADPTSFALRIDARALVPSGEWPFAASGGVSAGLEWGGRRLALSASAAAAEGAAPSRFEFRKHLAADSQPFELVATLRLGWPALPWGRMGLWTLFVSALWAASLAWQRQRSAQVRAQELLRLGQVGRLNALGELAAGLAHELNQPLTAVSASAQAAQRLLDDDPPDLATARQAMTQAVQQSRRAADVVGRLRRVVERPDVGTRLQAWPLVDTLRSALDLLQPECRRLGLVPELHAAPPLPAVQAEPVALEQIVHNLLANALQALEQVPPGERRLRLTVRAENGGGVLEVLDSGPGIAPEVLPHLFEPFFSTRAGGLGLGLSLCESLATGMGGVLTASNAPARGALFRLRLPLAPT